MLSDAYNTPVHSNVLELVHDNTIAGHLGVRKTRDSILRHFFWPGLSKSVRELTSEHVMPARLLTPIRNHKISMEAYTNCCRSNLSQKS